MLHTLRHKQDVAATKSNYNFPTIEYSNLPNTGAQCLSIPRQQISLPLHSNCCAATTVLLGRTTGKVIFTNFIVPY